MNAPLRRGACPALSDPMPTGDGLIARLKPAGAITPAMLAGLADAALAFGNGLMEVTQRGNLQFRGLTPESAPLLADAVNRLGIPAAAGLTVDVGPLAGIDPDAVADPRPVADAIRAATTPLAARLGPKVSVVVDGGGSFGLDAVQGDVRLTAVRAHPHAVWRLAIGGDAVTAAVLGDLTEDRACGVAVAILKDVAKLGRDARARDLPPERAGEILEGPGSTLPPSVLPSFRRGADISPTRGEIGSLTASTNLDRSRTGAEESGQLISPLVGEMSGRTEGGAKDRIAAGVIRLKGDRFAARVGLPFGSVNARDLIAFVSIIDATDLRFAPHRSLLLVCETWAVAEATLAAARNHGLIVDADDPRLSIAACAGAPACASGHIPARAIAAEIAAVAPPLSGKGPTVHISGCAKGCAHPGPAALTIVGDATGAALVVNGTASGTPAAHVKPQAIVEACLERLSPGRKTA